MADRSLNSSQNSRTNRSKLVVAFIAVFSFTSLLYIRTLWAGFLEYDDQFFILGDKAIKALTFSNLIEIFTEPYFANFHPLTRLSFAFDFAIWGVNPMGFHISSLFYYSVGCGLVFLLLYKLLDNIGAACAAAFLFAAHTTHVEAAAWISARKDLLCLIFGTASLYFFIMYKEKKKFSVVLFLGILVFSFLAGLSKSLAIILPFLILSMSIFRYRVVEHKDLLVVLAVILIMVFVGVENFQAQDEAGAVKKMRPSISTMGEVVFSYFWKTVIPANLSARYVVDPGDRSMLFAILGGALFLFFAAFALMQFLKKRRLAPLVFTWFVIPLLPVSNIVPLSIQMADRYLLWPSLAWCLLVGAWLKHASHISLDSAKNNKPVTAAYGLWFCLLIVVCGLTVARCEVWLDDEKLWKDALEENEDNYFALGALGRIALNRSDNEEASRFLSRAMQQNHGADSSIYLNYGLLMSRLGRRKEALDSYRDAFNSGGENSWFAHRAAGNIAMMLSDMGQKEEAKLWFEKALDLIVKTQESRIGHYLGLGKVHYDLKEFDKAQMIYKEACKEDPDDPRPCFYLGLALQELSRYQEAEDVYKKALTLKREQFDYSNVHLMLGKLYDENLNFSALALAQYQMVLEINPSHPQKDSLQAVIRSLSSKLKVK